jgi:hypothetical protein
MPWYGEAYNFYPREKTMLKPFFEKLFLKDFKINLYGSIIFESMKLIHECALFYFLPLSLYGLQGFLFSMIYLTVYFTDLGFVSGLAPFVKDAISSKKNCRQFLLTNITYQFFFLFITGIFALHFTINKFPILTPSILIYLLILIFSETVRIFLRTFLHITFTTKPTVLIELSITTSYIIIFWSLYFYNQHGSLEIIFLPYTITSLLATGSLSYLVSRLYKNLPNDNPIYTGPTLRTIFTTRLNAYALITPKKIFTGNCMVPLLSNALGIEKIALMKIASYIVDSARAIMRATIGFSGNALLSLVSKETTATKRTAFSLIFQKCILIFISFFSIALIIIPFYNNYHYFLYTTTTKIIFIYTILFLVLMLMDQLFVLYEQFYLMEQQAHKILFIRSIELLSFYYFFILYKQVPITFLSICIILRIISFILLTIHAYTTWKLIPQIKNPYLYLVLLSISTLVITLLTYYNS